MVELKAGSRVQPHVAVRIGCVYSRTFDSSVVSHGVSRQSRCCRKNVCREHRWW